MNGRVIYRKYAQSKGKEAKQFDRIEPEMYDYDTLYTKDSQGREEKKYKDLVNFIIRTL